MSVMRMCGLMAAWVLLGLALFLEPALAEKRVALVIGNGAYKAAGRLVNPVSDAGDMASALRSVGFSVDVVLDVDRARFETAISDFSDKASGADVALVFYAGHGMGLGTETHLLPVDADFRNEFEARNRTIGLTALLGTLEGRAKTVLAFVDACRDNPLADRLAASMRGAGRAVSVTRGLARIDVGASDTLVVYATTPGRTAADGTGRNSPFTTALLAHLGTEGVEIEVLLKRVSARVQELTGNQQEPERLSRLKREFYFKPAGASPAAASADPEAPARADYAITERVGTVAAWDLFLGRHPSGYYADLARQARDKLPSPGGAPPSPPTARPPTQVAGTFPAVRPPGPVSCRDRPRLVSASARPAGPLSAEEAGCLQPKDIFKECDDCPEMVVVPAGSFTMGSPEGEPQRYSDEGPQRTVTIGRSLAVGKYPITVDQYRTFIEATGHGAGSKCWTFENGTHEERSGRSWRNPGFPQSGAHPVACVNWHDAQAYVAWLSRTSGERYRLLSESEWEYSARGRTEPGRYPRYFSGEEASAMCRYGNGADQTAKRSIKGTSGWTFLSCDDGYAYTSPVGQYEANAFGLHDVHGNVLQWVEDCYADSYRGAPTDGSAQATKGCDKRLLRGGSWSSGPGGLRSAFRLGSSPDYRGVNIGFRVARTLPL